MEIKNCIYQSTKTMCDCFYHIQHSYALCIAHTILCVHNYLAGSHICGLYSHHCSGNAWNRFYLFPVYDELGHLSFVSTPTTLCWHVVGAARLSAKVRGSHQGLCPSLSVEKIMVESWSYLLKCHCVAVATWTELTHHNRRESLTSSCIQSNTDKWDHQLSV